MLHFLSKTLKTSDDLSKMCATNSNGGRPGSQSSDCLLIARNYAYRGRPYQHVSVQFAKLSTVMLRGRCDFFGQSITTRTNDALVCRRQHITSRENHVSKYDMYHMVKLCLFQRPWIMAVDVVPECCRLMGEEAKVGC